MQSNYIHFSMAGPVAGQNEEEPVHQTVVVRGRVVSGRPCSVGEAAKLIRELLNKVGKEVMPCKAEPMHDRCLHKLTLQHLMAQSTPDDDLEPRLPRVAAALELLARQTDMKQAGPTGRVAWAAACQLGAGQTLRCPAVPLEHYFTSACARWAARHSVCCTPALSPACCPALLSALVANVNPKRSLVNCCRCSCCTGTAAAACYK